MNAVYHQRQQRLFTNALSCLARFSDKLSLRCAQPEDCDYAIRLSAINAAGSAFCAFCFFPEFFELYELDGDRRRADLVFHIRTLQTVLKPQLNRKLEKCELSLVDNEVESRLIVRLHNFNGVTKTHKLTFEDRKSQFPTSSISINQVIIEAKTITKLLDHFGARSSGEITLDCKKDVLSIKSKLDEFLDRSAKMGKSMMTEVKVDQRHFKTYKVEEDVELAFAMREFKAAIALADHLSLPLELNFSQAGAPLIIKLQCPAMVAQIFIATSTPAAETDDNSQAAMTKPAIGSQRQQDSQAEESRESIAPLEAGVEDKESGTLFLDELETPSGQQESEIVHSGGSMMDFEYPLQSTAPSANLDRIQSGQDAVHHGGPMTSTQVNVEEDDGQVNVEEDGGQGLSTTVEKDLFFDETSSSDYGYEMASKATMEQALEDVEARLLQHKSDAPRLSQPQLTMEEREIDVIPTKMAEEETAREETEQEEQESGGIVREEETMEADNTREEEGNYSALDDEEEIPSTQHDASSKRTKYESLF
ncbi:hypothetical protein CBS101457_005399 [Exobasidium rhododendri]|nr:hypothetical protein CBS101457_005399 [Exobasidium rhododendri]